MPFLDQAALLREGEYWVFAFAGDVTRLRDSKGVRYLARLLRNPGRELHALDLVMSDASAGEAALPAREQPWAPGSGEGVLLDPSTRDAYRRRLADLQEEVEEANAYHDPARAERAQQEIDDLVAELTGALGFGGGDRKTAADAERARQSVTRAVKGTVLRLGEAHPALGAPPALHGAHRGVLVLRPRSTRPDHLAGPSVTTDLIGRDAELAELDAALAEARRGEGGVVLVCGDAGIGKTALVESLVAMTAPTEVHVAWGRCWGGPGAAPYWPWAQVLRAVADIASDGDLVRRLGPGASDVVQLLPELAARLPALDPTPAAESLDARLRLFDAVAAFLGATATETGGLVVALDDLHDADEGSLQLLRTIVHGVRRVPLLVIGTYRVDEVARLPVHQQLLGLVSGAGRTLRLRGLDEDGVGALLARTATGADADTSRRVHDATDGNPFLVYEAARLLAHGRSDTVALPEEAHAIVRARLERLPADVRTLLAHAAVLGREFGLGTLAHLTGRPADDVLDSLAEAAAADVVEESALGQWTFVHALLQEALDDELDSARLTDLHRRAADALAPTGATARVALHRFKAGDPRAVEECAAAGRAAAVALAYEEAADWYERALAALEWSPRPRRSPPVRPARRPRRAHRQARLYRRGP